MIKVNTAIPQGQVNGIVKAEFSAIATEFERNFTERGEQGASVCVRVGNEVVADLWGGFKDPKSGSTWEQDTVSIIFSCTKAATALCAHLLIDRGQLDLYSPVSRYWPEFGRNGKESVSVLMMLNHSAGVPAFREPLKAGAYYDWDYMVERLGLEEPFWEPGTRNGYHMMSFGWTVGELIRRVSGKPLGLFFRDEIAIPMNLDFWIGMPEMYESRVAPMIPWRTNADYVPSPFVRALLADKRSISALAWMNNGGHETDTRQAHAAELGGGGGITNARSLSKMYVPLANDGLLNGRPWIGRDTITRMSQVSMATQSDATLLMPTRFSPGFMVSMDNRGGPPDNRDSVLIGDGAFGHVGAGGSIGFADPQAKLSFAYTMNRMGQGILLNERGQSLVDATYGALGYQSNKSGVWQ